MGWKIGDELQAEGLPPDVALKKSALSGFYLLDEMEGFSRVVVVDAVRTGTHTPGTVFSFPLEDLHTPSGPSPHSVGLKSVLETARTLGLDIPGRIHIIAVEAEDMETMGRGLTPSVAKSVPAAIEAVRLVL